MGYLDSIRRVGVQCLCLLACGLSGCTGYDLTLNEQPLRSSPSLLTPQGISHPALRECVQQTVRDQAIQAANQLQQLGCSHAGITDLEGLTQFTQLTHLDLSHNSLTRVALLSQLGHIIYLDLRGNPQLECEHLGRIKQHLSSNARLYAPRHCEPQEQD